jgi:transglutaminase-like putative cysteine protease
MAIEPSSVDWAAASRVSYLVTQRFRYEYSEPIRDLNHRLVVIPPERFGDQVRLRHDLSVAGEGVSYTDRNDRFGNVVFDVFAPRVSEAIEFAAEVSVERHAAEPNRLPNGWLADGYLLEPSPLTAADDRIRRSAEMLAGSSEWGLPLADSINDWVYQSMTYQYGVTGVRTTASEALALGSGVCQDYAHLMPPSAEPSAFPSRYVLGPPAGQAAPRMAESSCHPDATGDA